MRRYLAVTLALVALGTPSLVRPLNAQNMDAVQIRAQSLGVAFTC